MKWAFHPTGFAVLAFGKLGGEELNYSSDIDLVFLSDGDRHALLDVGTTPDQSADGVDRRGLFVPRRYAA